MRVSSLALLVACVLGLVCGATALSTGAGPQCGFGPLDFTSIAAYLQGGTSGTFFPYQLNPCGATTLCDTYNTSSSIPIPSSCLVGGLPTLEPIDLGQIETAKWGLINETQGITGGVQVIMTSARQACIPSASAPNTMFYTTRAQFFCGPYPVQQYGFQVFYDQPTCTFTYQISSSNACLSEEHRLAAQEAEKKKEHLNQDRQSAPHRRAKKPIHKLHH